MGQHLDHRRPHVIKKFIRSTPILYICTCSIGVDLIIYLNYMGGAYDLNYIALNAWIKETGENLQTHRQYYKSGIFILSSTKFINPPPQKKNNTQEQIVFFNIHYYTLYAFNLDGPPLPLQPSRSKPLYCILSNFHINANEITSSYKVWMDV